MTGMRVSFAPIDVHAAVRPRCRQPQGELLRLVASRQWSEDDARLVLAHLTRLLAAKTN